MAKSTAPVAAPALETNGSSNLSAPAAPRWPGWLLIALAVGIGWLLLLSVLAFWTANPATLNRQQILQSETVIEAEILDPAAGTVEIEQVLARRPHSPLVAGDEIQIPLHGDHWKQGEHRLLPLIRTKQGDWTVTPAPLPKTPLLDYPDAPELREQVIEVFSTAPGTPAVPR